VEAGRGLAALGHEVLTVAGPRGAAPPPPPRSRGGARTPLHLPPGIGGAGGGRRAANAAAPKALALALYPLVARLADEFRPDAVMERYYNFAGAGLLCARRRGIPSVLEVNAPLCDPPGTPKDRLDRALGRPLRRWAAWQARAADRIVTPLATTVGKLARSRQVVEAP